MKMFVVFALVGMMLCGMADAVFAKDKGKKAGADTAAMQSVEETVTGTLATCEEKKFGFSVADANGKIIAYLPKPKKLTVDVSPYVGMKVKVIGMAMAGKKAKGVVKFDGVKSVDKVEEKPSDAGKADAGK